MKRFTNVQSRVTAGIKTAENIDEVKPMGINDGKDLLESDKKAAYGGLPRSKLPAAKPKFNSLTRREPSGARRTLQAAGGVIG